ncbi:unnamed protein product [Urochloa humidicola]
MSHTTRNGRRFKVCFVPSPTRAPRPREQPAAGCLFTAAAWIRLRPPARALRIPFPSALSSPPPPPHCRPPHPVLWPPGLPARRRLILPSKSAAWIGPRRCAAYLAERTRRLAPQPAPAPAPAPTSFKTGYCNGVRRIMKILDDILEEDMQDEGTDEQTTFGALPAHFSAANIPSETKVLDPMKIVTRGAPRTNNKRWKASHEHWRSN